MILVTGGAGYIGSHCTLELIRKNYDVVIFDNLSTGHLKTVETLKQQGNVTFVKGDLTNSDEIKKVFNENKIEAVFHFAAFSQVGESVKNPKKYYNNNLIGTLNLLDAMVENNVNKLIFSSTAATYGEPQYIPIDEKHPQNPINTYGRTKLMIENILDDYDRAYGLKSVRLRYFNAAGANRESLIGEWHEPETHLIPNILKSVFVSDRTFKMFGTDYDTKDGTCVRDYIDVEDLAKAHRLALEYLYNNGETTALNLGTKAGYSVKEIFSICEEVTGKKIKVDIMPRREGDPATLLANNTKAKQVLKWEPVVKIQDSINNAFNWEKKLNS